MLSNPSAPLHPSLRNERDRDGSDTEIGRERQRGRKEGRTDGWETAKEKGSKRQKSFRERRRDDARQYVCEIFVRM